MIKFFTQIKYRGFILYPLLAITTLVVMRAAHLQTDKSIQDTWLSFAIFVAVILLMLLMDVRTENRKN